MATMFLIDGSNHAFRVHFGLPPMHATDGFPTRALYGFTTLFAKLLRVHRPDYVAVAFDIGSTFRHEMYPLYKANRPEMPEELKKQWGFLPDLVRAFGCACVNVQGFEADDVLGTLARKFGSEEVKVYLLTSDKDFCQLVDDNIHILDLMKDKELGPPEVVEKFGVGPEQVIDILGLAGDTSDNIPGIPGVGVKKASKYVKKYGSLDGVLAAAADIGGKTGEKIQTHAEDALMSRTLATIRLDVPLGNLDLADLVPKGMQVDELSDMFERWNFGRVAKKLLPARARVDRSHYRCIATEEDLIELVVQLKKAGRYAFDVETTSLDPKQAELVGLSFSWSATDAVYVPIAHTQGPQLDQEVLKRVLWPVLESDETKKIAHNLKYDFGVCQENGLEIGGLDGDTMLLDYMAAAHERGHGLDRLAQRYFGHTMITYDEVTDGGSIGFAEVPVDEATRYSAEDAHVTWLLYTKLSSQIGKAQQKLYEDVEVPLVPLLSKMERRGIKLDIERLKVVQVELEERLQSSIERCHELAGHPFRVNSRHELRDILFEELGLTGIKKVKDGWSTDSSVLEKLMDEHALPAAVLEYRSIAKLLSTYVAKLPGYVAADGRVHGSFNQAVTATGRLSSADPNLQNIPVRGVDGGRIRACFVPEEEHVFLSADYSQIELRVLAHFCVEGALVEAFRKGEDIHRRTASEVFDIPLEAVTSNERDAAKAINFGLLYGMSAFRLAGDLAIPRHVAQGFMDEYFGRMPNVEKWLEQTKQLARKQGYVETLYGRRRILPNIDSARFTERKAAEREAVNTCIQGTAADLIKMAMLRVERGLRRHGFNAQILLQVHDELLLEVPQAEIKGVRDLVRGEMESVALLAVPLVVNTAVGSNWYEAHG